MSAGILRLLSLRARLTLWYSLALLVVSVAFAATVVWQQGRIGMRRVDRELDDLSATLANVLRDELSEMPNPKAAAEEVQRTMASSDRATAVLEGDGHVLAASWSGLTLQTAIAPSAGPRAWTVTTAGRTWRVHVTPMAAAPQSYLLLVAAPLADVLREQHEAQEAMLVAIPLVLLLAAGGGWWLASRGLRPITAMAGRAESLAPAGMTDLGESDRRDELGQLARAFNGLLARLRQTLETQRAFMADASHELRTPVSVIQSAADVTLARERRDEREYREALSHVAAESRRLGRLVDDMLVLARADAGGYPLRREPVYLNELAADCRRSVAVLAQHRGVTIDALANGDVPFCGDESLLRRMILNLVQNAVACTRNGSRVSVAVVPNGRYAFIRVRDQGEGIAESDRARIFDRFVQLDAARGSAGAGLGLPIARWIAEAHGGSLDLEESGATGSTFRVTLPLESGLGALAQASSLRPQA
jgi:two-component system, OmpR family, sensor kinase